MLPRDIQALRDEIAALLSAAAQVEIDHAEATRLAAEAHQRELDDLVESARQLCLAHERQAALTAEAHDDDIEQLARALESRDVIGQAKGILMVTMRCPAEQAFALMVKESQYENRKLTDVATEIVERAEQRAFARTVADGYTGIAVSPDEASRQSPRNGFAPGGG